MKTTLAICIGTLVIATIGSGCGSEESLAGSNTTMTAAPAAGAPSFTEIDAALELNQEDEAVVKTALAEWSRAAGGKRFGARQGEMKFVSAVAPSLDNDQLGKLVDMVVTQRDARREQMRERRDSMTPGQVAKQEARRGEPRRKHRGAAFAEQAVEHRAAWLDATLDLEDDQEPRVKAALETVTRAQVSIRTARKDGSITREQAREQMRAAHETLEEALKAILTEEQEARLEILQPLFPGRRHHA